MKKKLLWASLSLLLVALLSVGVVAATFEMPSMEGVDEIEILRLRGKDLEAQVHARIHNGNWFGLGARRLDYLVTYRDTVVGKGKLAELSLPAGDTTAIALPVDMALGGIFAVHKAMLAQDRCALDIHLEADFTFLNIRHGLDLRADVEPKDFIEDVMRVAFEGDGVSVEELKWEGSDLSQSAFAFLTVVKNPLDVDLELRSVALEVFNEGQRGSRLGEWRLAKPQPLPAQYSTRVPGRMELRHLEAGKGMLGTVLKGELRLDAVGKVQMALAGLVFDIPLDGKLVFGMPGGKGRWE